MADADVLQIPVNYNNNKDYTLGADKFIEQAPEHSRYTDPVAIVTAQDLTEAYVDFGSPINMNWYTKLGMKVTYDINLSIDCDIQVLGMNSADDSTPAEVDGISTKRVFSSIAGWDTDWEVMYEFTVNSIQFVQIQAMVATLGATAWDLTIEIFKIY